MQGLRAMKTVPLLGVILAVPGLCACNTQSMTRPTSWSSLSAKPVAVTDEERDCLGRAMYFESNRSDSEGLLAVGTVVMNRVEAAPTPVGICDVVGQPRQFAPGVLTKPMQQKDLPKVADAADAVLAGQRHAQVGRAMYFHTAGHRFPYDNMHYVAVAGGNAFYEKRKAGAAQVVPVTTAMAMTRPVQASAPATRMAYAEEPTAGVTAAQTILNEPAKDICRVAGLASTSRGG